VQQPPSHVVAWAESQLGARVTGVRPMAGGIDAATFGLTTVQGDDVVLRLTTDDDHDDVAYQARVLDLLAATTVPAPHTIAVADDIDPWGRRVLLSSLLPGDPTLPVAPTDEWLTSLAETVVAMQRVSPASWSHDRVAVRWDKLDAELPAELGADDEFLRAALLARRNAAPLTQVFGHDDFWVGNTLRSGDRIVGVVDWGHAGVVSVARDVTYCAVDASLCFGLDIGDRLVELFLQRVEVDAAELLLWTGHSVLASRYFREWLAGWNGLGVPVLPEQAEVRRAELLQRVLSRLT
jgi:aminoglycoside phosphotransferase (APT) family kinase protein